jgi:acetyltransferase-like isoleucine patch superfamily enzyme
MSFGKYTYGPQPNIHWKNDNAKLVIGNFCSFANNLNIYLGGNHNINWITTYPFGTVNSNVFDKFNVDCHGHPFTKGDVVISNDVWIGNNVTIMSGVTIGDGAVIANNSHVVKNVEPYSLVGGNPAKLVKYRFTPEQIEKLLEIKWWYWDDEKINECTHLLCNSNIDEFIKFAINK